MAYSLTDAVLVGVVVFLVMYVYQDWKSKKRKDSFAPFYIRIQPNWHELLKDYKLVDTAGWQMVMKKVGAKEGPDEYDILRRGMMFTVLKSNPEEELVYNNNHNTFSSEVDFREDLGFLRKDPDDIFSFSPDVYVKWGTNGFELGVTTPESDEKVVMVGDNNDLVGITTIPYTLFGLTRYRFGIARNEAEIEDQLKKFGWERDEATESLRQDVLYAVPTVLNHKYFTVYYDFI